MSSNTQCVSTDLPALQKELRAKLEEELAMGTADQENAAYILACVDDKKEGWLLHGHFDSYRPLFVDSELMGYEHIKRSQRGPTTVRWEIHTIPVWKLDPPPECPEPLFVIHMHEQQLVGVYSNMQGNATVVFFDVDEEFGDEDEETDRKLELLRVLIKRGLVREISQPEGTSKNMESLILDGR